MRYEEKYKEALERAKKLYEQGTITESLNYVFPELKESEDEKIRKALVEMVHDTTGDSLWIDYDVHKEDALAWLKKRGEQKIADKYNITGIKSKHAEGKLGEMIKEMESANKVEPKFKVGDWIYHEISGNVFHINRIENRTYISDEGATISFGRQNDWRLWTIKETKGGIVMEFVWTFLSGLALIIIAFSIWGKD